MSTELFDNPICTQARSKPRFSVSYTRYVHVHEILKTQKAPFPSEKSRDNKGRGTNYFFTGFKVCNALKSFVARFAQRMH